jgi:hypothetical protein
MLRKQVEIEGERFTLGEATAGAVEECQEVLREDSAASDSEKVAAMRRFLAHSLNRGGFTIAADAVRDRFSMTEIAFLFQHASRVSGLREVPAGEVLGP